MKKISSITDKFFTWIADNLGTDTVIVLFTLIAIVPLFYQTPRNILEWQQWISQTAIQLIALAILAKVSKIEGGKQSKLIQETHDMTMNEIGVMKETHNTELKEIVMLKDMHKTLIEEMKLLKDEHKVMNKILKAVCK